MNAFSNVSDSETLDMINGSVAIFRKYLERMEGIPKQIDRFAHRFIVNNYKRLTVNVKDTDTAEDKKMRGTIVTSL